MRRRSRSNLAETWTGSATALLVEAVRLPGYASALKSVSGCWCIMARMRIASTAVLALSVLAAQSTTTPAPDATGQAGDAAILQSLKAKAPSLLLLRGEEQRVAYANIEQLAPVNTIRAGGPVYPLPEAPRDFSAFRYEHEGARQTIDDFMQQMNVVGLLVITDGRIVLERYARGHTANSRWASMSVAKSVTSLLYGAAVRDGLILAHSGSAVPDRARTPVRRSLRC